MANSANAKYAAGGHSSTTDAEGCGYLVHEKLSALNTEISQRKATTRATDG